MLNSNLGGGIPGYMGESGVKATSPTDPHLSDPHAAANDSRAASLVCRFNARSFVFLGFVVQHMQMLSCSCVQRP